jgi:hypothetical protein
MAIVRNQPVIVNFQLFHSESEYRSMISIRFTLGPPSSVTSLLALRFRPAVGGWCWLGFTVADGKLLMESH